MSWPEVVAFLAGWGPYIAPVLVTILVLKFPALKPYAAQIIAALSRLRGPAPATPAIDPAALEAILRALIAEQDGPDGYRTHLLREIGYRSALPLKYPESLTGE